MKFLSHLCVGALLVAPVLGSFKKPKGRGSGGASTGVLGANSECTSPPENCHLGSSLMELDVILGKRIKSISPIYNACEPLLKHRIFGKNNKMKLIAKGIRKNYKGIISCVLLPKIMTLLDEKAKHYLLAHAYKRILSGRLWKRSAKGAQWGSHLKELFLADNPELIKYLKANDATFEENVLKSTKSLNLIIKTDAVKIAKQHLSDVCFYDHLSRIVEKDAVKLLDHALDGKKPRMTIGLGQIRSITALRTLERKNAVVEYTSYDLGRLIVEKEHEMLQAVLQILGPLTVPNWALDEAVIQGDASTLKLFRKRQNFVPTNSLLIHTSSPQVLDLFQGQLKWGDIKRGIIKGSMVMLKWFIQRRSATPKFLRWLCKVALKDGRIELLKVAQQQDKDSKPSRKVIMKALSDGGQTRALQWALSNMPIVIDEGIIRQAFLRNDEKVLDILLKKEPTLIDQLIKSEEYIWTTGRVILWYKRHTGYVPPQEYMNELKRLRKLKKRDFQDADEKWIRPLLRWNYKRTINTA